MNNNPAIADTKGEVPYADGEPPPVVAYSNIWDCLLGVGGIRTKISGSVEPKSLAYILGLRGSMPWCHNGVWIF